MKQSLTLECPRLARGTLSAPSTAQRMMWTATTTQSTLSRERYNIQLIINAWLVIIGIIVYIDYLFSQSHSVTWEMTQGWAIICTRRVIETSLVAWGTSAMAARWVKHLNSSLVAQLAIFRWTQPPQTRPWVWTSLLTRPGTSCRSITATPPTMRSQRRRCMSESRRSCGNWGKHIRMRSGKVWTFFYPSVLKWLFLMIW